MNNPPSPDPDATRKAIAACAKDPAFRGLLLERLSRWVDNEPFHATYLDAFFARIVEQAADFPREKAVKKRIVARFKPWARELEETLFKMKKFFADDIRKGKESRVRQRVLMAIFHYLRGDAPDCEAYIFLTLMRRICGYDAGRSLDHWILGSVESLVGEWGRAKRGVGGNKREKTACDLVRDGAEDERAGGLIGNSAGDSPDPGAELAVSEDRKIVYDFLKKNLTEADRQLLELADIDGLESLAVASVMGYVPPNRRIALDLARLLLAARFSRLKELLSAMRIQRSGWESVEVLTGRIWTRAAKSILLSSTIQQLAESEAVSPAGVVTGAARLLLARRYDPAVRIMHDAGLHPLPRETEEHLMERILAARATLPEVGAMLEKFENMSIADLVRQNLRRLHLKCRALLKNNPEIYDAVRAIRRRPILRGVEAPELYFEDDSFIRFDDSSNQLEAEDDEDEKQKDAA